jgi:hypothetical protein
MEQQVIKELIELVGTGNRVEFKDLTVKKNPHSWPVPIHEIYVGQDRELTVVVGKNKDEYLFKEVSSMVQNTTTQRLRLMVHLKQSI